MNRKMNSHLSLFTFILTLVSSITVADETIFVKPVVMQTPAMEQFDTLFDELSKPVQFHKRGVQEFLQHTFSRTEYAQEFLPHTFSHMLEFLQFGKDSHQNSVYVTSTIRLFGNKLKMCSYISESAFNDLLERLPTLLEAHLVKTPLSLVTEARNTLKRLMYNTFLSKFSFFKEDPDTFFEDLSGELLEGLNRTQYIQNSVDKEQLRQQLIRFLELALNKVMWSPQEPDVWTSVKATSEYLHTLMDCAIINRDDLDDLYQSLIARFIYFLDLVGSELSLEVIQAIKADIGENRLLLLTMEEQEEFIEAKAERLLKAVERAETRVIAYQETGLVAQ
ncbi:MAG: hypothetical protein WCE21_02225 [Candidatus Babeliales bacterium]